MNDTEVIAKYYELRSCRAAGEYYGCSGETIRRILIKHGVKLTGWKTVKSLKRPHRRPVQCTDEEIISMYERFGVGAVKIKFGISGTTVYRTLKKHGIKANGRSKNECPGGTPSKITDAEILEEVKNKDLFEIAKRHAMSPERLYRRARKLGIDVKAHWAEDKWKRRAAFYGFEIDFDRTITLKSVCDKFNGICQICGQPVDWNDCENGHIKRMYPTVDHIIPLSKGGQHTWNNVQLAHMKCNAGKCDKVSIDGRIA